MRTFRGYSTVDKRWGNFKLYDVDLAKQDLLNEFYTRKGERLMSPNFGSIIWDLLFDPMTEQTINLIREDCIRIVTKDPRFELRQMQINENFELQQIIVKIFLFYVPTATVTELIAAYFRDIKSE